MIITIIKPSVATQTRLLVTTVLGQSEASIGITWPALTNQRPRSSPWNCHLQLSRARGELQRVGRWLIVVAVKTGIRDNTVTNNFPPERVIEQGEKMSNCVTIAWNRNLCDHRKYTSSIRKPVIYCNNTQGLPTYSFSSSSHSFLKCFVNGSCPLSVIICIWMRQAMPLNALSSSPYDLWLLLTHWFQHPTQQRWDDAKPVENGHIFIWMISFETQFSFYESCPLSCLCVTMSYFPFTQNKIPVRC